MPSTEHFDYSEAFSRTLGWITEREQQLLRGKRVAIAGMGGVGGAHLLMLTRLGIGAFSVADPDRFEIANFNRQVGAKLSTVGKRKVSIMAAEALDINPELELTALTEPIHAGNVDAFLRNTDLFVDGLDFFAFDARILLFRRCRELGIPAITAAPLGMAVAHLTFMPDSMSFDEYFGLEECAPDERAARFLVGLVPRPEHHRYLVDSSRVALDQQKGPSTPMACQLAASAVGVQALKILLERPGVLPTPNYHLYDAYFGKAFHGSVPFGHRHPLQRIKTRVAQELYARSRASARPAEKPSRSSVTERILDHARWAPSGDNGQPWRFHVRSESTIKVHVKDEFDHDLYDRDGDFSLVSTGFLLENMRLAAADEGRAIDWRYCRISAHEHEITVDLRASKAIAKDPLVRFIQARSTNRFPYLAQPLTTSQKSALEACIGESLELIWYESLEDRLSIARLNAMATDIRLRCREAHDVHRRVIDFDSSYSPTGIPARAVGLNSAVLRVMRWAMRDFERVQTVNRILGTGAARLEMDLLPGLMCGAHFMIAFRQPPRPEERGEALLRAGEEIQRFWLKATHLGLAMQPGNAPIIFGSYGEREHPFTDSEDLRARARELARRVSDVSKGLPARAIVFAGRIGTPRSTKAGPRSVRRTLGELILEVAPKEHANHKQPARELESEA